jgi:hypothetical protein
LIIGLATQHHLPTIYQLRSFAAEGGLLSYGVDPIHQFEQAAAYVDRILRGTLFSRSRLKLALFARSGCRTALPHQSLSLRSLSLSVSLSLSRSLCSLSLSLSHSGNLLGLIPT